MQVHLKRSGRLARCIAFAMLGLGAVPAAAAADCPQLPTSNVFAALGDTSQYFLAPGGSFEGASTSWSGGTLLAGNEPFYVGGGRGVKSLRIATGATATSPVFCADVLHPDFRFVARPLTPYSMSYLEISVRFLDRFNVLQTWPVGGVGAPRAWGVTSQIRLTKDLPLPVSGQTTVQVLFRAVGGDWAVDDVFIDPFRR